MQKVPLSSGDFLQVWTGLVKHPATEHFHLLRCNHSWVPAIIHANNVIFWQMFTNFDKLAKIKISQRPTVYCSFMQIAIFYVCISFDKLAASQLHQRLSI